MADAALSSGTAPLAGASGGGDFAVVLVTAKDRAQGLEIARALVGEHLAACVNVLDGATSVYRWEGKVCEDAEALLVVKTRRASVARVAERVKALHSYTCPETIALPIIDGAPGYLAWLAGETVLEGSK